MGTEPRTNPRETPPGSRLALGALIFGAVGIACAPIFVRLSEVGPTATAFWRLALALPFLWLWTEVGSRQGAAGPSRRLSGRRTLLGLALTGLFFAGDLALWHWSIGFTSVANSTLLVNLAPVFVALGGRLLFGERFTYTFLVGMAVALAGAVLLVGGDLGLGPRQLFGDALAVLAAVFYAGYILSVSRLRSRLSTAAVMTYGGIATCVALLPVALLSGEDFLATTVYGWLMLLGIAFVSQIGGQSLITYSLADLPAAFSSVGLLLQPIAAAALAWAILGEALGWWQVLGGAIVLTGIVLARRGSLPGDQVTSRSRPVSTS
jgi:drug/metabolite transporter (DMT)-like permease